MNSHLSLTPFRILIASSEAQSLMGSGTLAEFVTTLSSTLDAMGHDIRLVLPAYPHLLAQAKRFTQLTRIYVAGSTYHARILQGKLHPNITVYLIDIPGQFNSPIHHENAENGNKHLPFGWFSRVVTLMAINQVGLNWQPDLLHCNGWQSALAIALLAGEWGRPATVYTVHDNRQPFFSSQQIRSLSIPVDLLKTGALAIDGHFSFERGALLTADRITTPSSGYCVELMSEQTRYPFADILKTRLERFSAAPSGIDYHRWSPTTDPCIEQHFDSSSFALKRMNRQRLLAELGIELDNRGLLISYIGCHIPPMQTNLLIKLLPKLEQLAPLTLLTTVSDRNETLQKLQALSETVASSFVLQIDKDDEALKHRIIASSDCLLLPDQSYPSPFLAQCALSYGTVPIVHATKTMQEVLTDATPAHLLHGVATGFLYSENTLEQLLQVLGRVHALHKKPAIWWQKLARNGMNQSFHPSETTLGYLKIYQSAIDNPASSPA